MVFIKSINKAHILRHFTIEDNLTNSCWDSLCNFLAFKFTCSSNRNLALKFNNRFGDILTIPEELIPEEVAVVPGIDGQKMSKSYNNTIPIFDKEKALRKVIMSVVTDSKGLEEPKDPDTCNVYALYKLVATPEELQEMRERMLAGNYGYGHAKQALFEKLWAYFEPMRKRREELENNLDYVRDLLKRNGERARNEAAILLDKVREAVGLR